MNIYIMRHGEAGYDAHSDAQRVLTNAGKQQTREMANWLKHQDVLFDYALVSPFTRTQQTLKVVQSVIPIASIEICEDLTPDGTVEVITNYLSTLHTKSIKSILIVSHLPLVGYLVSALCPTLPPPNFATATVALVTLSPSGEGTYKWMHSIR